MTSSITYPLTSGISYSLDGSLGQLMGSLRGSASLDIGSFSISTPISNMVFGHEANSTVDTTSAYVGLVEITTGDQYLLEFDKFTGSLRDQFMSSTAYSLLDNHNSFSVTHTPADALLTRLASHDATAEVRYRRSSTGLLVDFGAEIVKATAETATYPKEVAQDATTGNIYDMYRGTIREWYCLRSQTDGLTWSEFANPVFIDNDQCYVKTAQIPALGNAVCFMIASTNPNLDNAKIYSATVNFVTGAIKKADGTTIANFITGSPKLSAEAGDMDVFYAPGAGKSASTGSFSEDGHRIAFHVFDNSDNQYAECYVGEWSEASNIADPTEWTFTRQPDLGYGSGSLTGTPFSAVPRPEYSGERDLPGPRFFCAVNQRGYYRRVRRDKISGSWYDTLVIRETAIDAVDRQDSLFQAIEGAEPTFPVIMLKDEHRVYDNIINAELTTLHIISSGTGAPTLTSSATLTSPEYRDFITTLTADRPCGFNITGGADAALFEIAGSQLYTRAKSFAAPEDANTDNVYQVEITPVGMNLQLGAPVLHSLTITNTTKSGLSQLITQTGALNNAAWTRVGIAAGTTGVNPNDATFTDPNGGTAYARVTMDATTTGHRLVQAKTATANLDYFMAIKVHSQVCRFVGMQQTFGAGTTSLVGVTFDTARGRYVGPVANNTLAPSWTCVRPVPNGAFLLAAGWRAPASVAAGEVRFFLRQYSGPQMSELGTTSSRSWWIEPEYGQSDRFLDYVLRTT